MQRDFEWEGNRTIIERVSTDVYSRQTPQEASAIETRNPSDPSLWDSREAGFRSVRESITRHHYTLLTLVYPKTVE